MSVESYKTRRARDIKYVHVTITSPAADVFPSDVPEGKTRHILGIVIDAQHDTGVERYTINRVDESDVVHPFLDSIVVPAADHRSIPESGEIDIDKPILNLAGGENLSVVKDNTTDAEATIWYYDEPEVT